MVKRVIFPGTFDPVTYDNPSKAVLFNLKERVSMVRRAVGGIKAAKVEAFRGLVIDYVKKKKTNVIIRGLRMISDFEYEFQMALTNRKLSNDIETIFMMPSESYSYISSRLLKEAASLGADLEDFVPSFVAKKLKEKLRIG